MYLLNENYSQTKIYSDTFNIFHIYSLWLEMVIKYDKNLFL